MERLAENELRNLLHTVINRMPSLLVYVDMSYRIVFWNDNAREMSAIETDAARGRDVSEVLPFLKSCVAVIQRAIETGQVQKNSFVAASVEGSTRAFAITIYPNEIENGGTARGALILAEAVPNRESPENAAFETASEVLFTRRIEQIAHDINNHLAGMLQNIQVIRHRLIGDLPKNRSLAEECGTTLEVIKAYIDKRGIVPMIEAIQDSGNRAARAVTTELRVKNSNHIK